MADYYVNYAQADDTGAGTSWATAKKTLAAGVALCTTAGDNLWIVNTHAESVTATTSYNFSTGTIAAPIKVFSTSDTVNEPPQSVAAGAEVYLNLQGGDFTLTGFAYVYGLGLRCYTGGTSSQTEINIATTNGGLIHAESCTFDLGTNPSTLGGITIGTDGAADVTNFRSKNCTFKTSVAGTSIKLLGSYWESVGDTFSYRTAAPTVAIYIGSRGGFIDIKNANMTALTGSIFGSANATNQQAGTIHISNSALASGATMVSAPAAYSLAFEVTAINCAYGDVHHAFYHWNWFGSTTVSTTVYANDGATYDGTNPYSLVIVGSNASEQIPYKSPWISKYQTAATISPYLEILRNNDSTNAFKDDQVWAEFSIQGKAGTPQGELYDDRNTAWMYTNADQAAGVGLSGWTGETGSCWSGKLGVSSIVVDEIGPLMARVCVAGAYTVYVDPQIRT